MCLTTRCCADHCCNWDNCACGDCELCCGTLPHEWTPAELAARTAATAAADAARAASAAAAAEELRLNQRGMETEEMRARMAWEHARVAAAVAALHMEEVG
jgi:hypothetical protein